MVRAIGSHCQLRLRQQWRRSGCEEPIFLEHENQNIRKPVVREGKVRGQIAEVKTMCSEGSYLCNLTSDLYNPPMPLIDQIQKDIVAPMKAREEDRLSCLRMVKTALKNREIDKMAPLDDKESQQVLSTLIKQRKDSVEQFTKGGRQEM